MHGSQQQVPNSFKRSGVPATALSPSPSLSPSPLSSSPTAWASLVTVSSSKSARGEQPLTATYRLSLLPVLTTHTSLSSVSVGRNPGVVHLLPLGEFKVSLTLQRNERCSQLIPTDRPYKGKRLYLANNPRQKRPKTEVTHVHRPPKWHLHWVWWHSALDPSTEEAEADRSL